MGPMLLHTCSVARNQAVGTNGRRQFASVASPLPCLLLPLSTQAALHNNMEPGRSFDVYFDDGTDVRVGDRLTINSVSYIVKGVQDYAQIPVVGHVHALVETEHANGL